jgi:Co/Zn/Cd efflux system component
MTVGRSNRSRERADRRKKQMAFLHQAFHPNCNDADCSASHNITSVPAPDASNSEIVEKEESNLNLYGAVLHLLTDVLRSLVILVVALLVEFGVIRDAPSADAICAIAVSLCIILGCVPLLRAAGTTLYRAWRPTQALGADFQHQIV